MYFILWWQFKSNFLKLTEVKNGLQLSSSLSAIKFLLCQTKHVSGTCFPTLLSFFPLLPESKWTDMYGDIITKFSWMDRLPNYLNNGALFARASQVRVELHYKHSPHKWSRSITQEVVIYEMFNLKAFTVKILLFEDSGCFCTYGLHCSPSFSCSNWSLHPPHKEGAALHSSYSCIRCYTHLPSLLPYLSSLWFLST